METDVENRLLKCRELHDAGRYSEAMFIALDCVSQTQLDLNLQWKSLTALGIVLRADARFESALEVHRAALTVATGENNAARIAMSWNNIGAIFLTACEWDTAVECFSRVTEDRTLVKAWPPYQAHGNLALCYLHLGMIPNGITSIKQALRHETAELVGRDPYSYVIFRLTFVQLALESNRLLPREIKQRAEEAYAFSKKNKADRHIHIVCDLIKANMEFAFGDRDEGLRRMELLSVEAREVPQIMSDVLFSLVQAEKILGRPQRARAYLRDWTLYLFLEGGRHAAEKFGIEGASPAGRFLNRHLSDIGEDEEILPPLPTWIVELMRRKK